METQTCPDTTEFYYGDLQPRPTVSFSLGMSTIWKQDEPDFEKIRDFFSAPVFDEDVLGSVVGHSRIEQFKKRIVRQNGSNLQCPLPYLNKRIRNPNHGKVTFVEMDLHTLSDNLDFFDTRTTQPPALRRNTLPYVQERAMNLLRHAEAENPDVTCVRIHPRIFFPMEPLSEEAVSTGAAADIMDFKSGEGSYILREVDVRLGKMFDVIGEALNLTPPHFWSDVVKSNAEVTYSDRFKQGYIFSAPAAFAPFHLCTAPYVVALPDFEDTDSPQKLTTSDTAFWDLLPVTDIENAVESSVDEWKSAEESDRDDVKMLSIPYLFYHK